MHSIVPNIQRGARVRSLPGTVSILSYADGSVCCSGCTYNVCIQSLEDVCMSLNQFMCCYFSLQILQFVKDLQTRDVISGTMEGAWRMHHYIAYLASQIYFLSIWTFCPECKAIHLIPEQVCLAFCLSFHSKSQKPLRPIYRLKSLKCQLCIINFFSIWLHALPDIFTAGK